MTSNRRYKPFISSAKSIERGEGPLIICKSFPCGFEEFSSTPRRVEKKEMDESEGTHNDFHVAQGRYS
jgi:hypothetical protein